MIKGNYGIDNPVKTKRRTGIMPKLKRNAMRKKKTARSVSMSKRKHQPIRKKAKPLSTTKKSKPRKRTAKKAKRVIKASRVRNKIITVIGSASGLGGVEGHTSEGPIVLKQSRYLKALNLPLKWDAMLRPDLPKKGHIAADKMIGEFCYSLAEKVSGLAKKKKPFLVVGGDHTCAVGTWSGAYDALHQTGDIGLIWIDAHMDSHTPESSITQHIHGMPLAVLLGYGFKSLTRILHLLPKLKPRNVCLIGVRSFEYGEAILLKHLNVRVYFMQEVKTRGFAAVLKEAVKHVSEHTVGYGISLDIDSMDPMEAPGVDVPEAGGIGAKDMIAGLKMVVSDPKLIAAEIVEFDPSRDENEKTEKIAVSLLDVFAKGMAKASKQSKKSTKSKKSKKGNTHVKYRSARR